MLKSSVKLFQTCLFLEEIWIWTFKSWFMLELAWISVFCLPSLFTKSLIYLSHSNLEVRRKIPKWVVPWITVSVQGTNCRVLTVDFGWSLKKKSWIAVSTQGTNCRFWVVPTKKTWIAVSTQGTNCRFWSKGGGPFEILWNAVSTHGVQN